MQNPDLRQYRRYPVTSGSEAFPLWGLPDFRAIELKFG